MPRLEFKKRTSSKFWEIDLEGKTCTVTFGRIGTAGASKSRRFENDAEARRHYDQLIQEKTTKGYRAAVDRSTKKDSRASVLCLPASPLGSYLLPSRAAPCVAAMPAPATGA